MNELFDRKALQKLIIPLIIEQVLAVAVGMSDIIMVSMVGQSAMSGVSLVDIIAVLLIQVFSALATGGAVISAQYLGQKNLNRACMAANQLILSIGVLSTFIAVLALIGNPYILSTIYGQIEPDVMKNARIYFYITALSYPFLGIYNGAAALCRSMGNSKASMNTSLIMNGLNLGGNAFLVFGLKLGVEGVAIPTLVSRIIAATVMLIIIHDQKNPIHINAKFRLGFQPKIIKEILCIGIPTGLDSSLFQIG
ncbi:MAG: MATE family efflux transporter, partial [Lachnospiraceae bacterium]